MIEPARSWMRCGGVTSLAFAVALAPSARAAAIDLSLAQRPPTPVRLVPSAVLEPPAVLARYAAALAALKEPKSLSFEFTVEQSGLRSLEQSHRVYRAGSNERDETLAADGYTLTSPSVRIFHGRVNRYDIKVVAPKTVDYDFTFAGLARVGERVDYLFHTKRRAPASYAVTSMVLDGTAFLPVSIAFTVASGGAKGKGAMTFGATEGHWLVREASVDAIVAGKPAREHIGFGKYAFPELPASTFEQSHRAAALPPPSEPVEAP